MGWAVYLDESGDFEHDHTVCVAGVLVPRDAGPDEVALAQWMRRRFDFVPWPLHAAHLNLPILLALAALRTDRPFPGRAALDTLRQRLSWRQRDSVRRVDEALAAGACPPFDDLRVLQAEVGPGEDAALLALQRAFFDQLKGLMADLATDGVRITLAGEACPRAPQPRYRALLVGLAGHLGQRAPGGGLKLHVLWRPAREAADEPATPLNRSRIERWLAEADAGRVKLAWLGGFDRRASPWLVLADFVANRTRRVLRDAQSLADLEGGLLAWIGVGGAAADTCWARPGDATPRLWAASLEGWGHG
ncbi:MAG: hypothetical protein KC613_05235 [Myxococcales bacterium]|nr:hypothetical protein [Myxococcales bacterium]MCB9524829.1 hypothetical protein [Myxococcales bacterium]